MKNIFIFSILISGFITAQQDTNFSIGFKEGYIEGYCYQLTPTCIKPLAPLAPLPNLKESASNYKDGYQRGFLLGQSQPKEEGRKPRIRNIENDWTELNNAQNERYAEILKYYSNRGQSNQTFRIDPRYQKAYDGFDNKVKEGLEAEKIGNYASAAESFAYASEKFFWVHKGYEDQYIYWTYLKTANNYQRIKDYKKAEKYYKNILKNRVIKSKIDPEIESYAYLNYTQLLHEQSQNSSAQNLIKEALKKYPQNSKLLDLKITLDQNEGKK